jgi:hypothetical protein
MFHLEEYPNGTGEMPTNFRVAEAIVNLANGDDRIDAETVAKMILLQVDAKKGGE